MQFDTTHHIWKFDIFQSVGINHAITTRHTFGYDDFNLSGKEENHSQSVKYRQLLCEKLCNDIPVRFPKQVSASDIWIIKSGTDQQQVADAVITNTPNLPIGILVADCVPVILHDPVLKILALVHAGWRGSAQKIVQKTIKTMTEQYSSDPGDILCGIGPSISPEVYEIGADVLQEFLSHNYSQPFYIEKKNGKYLLDLWTINTLQLFETGIIPQHIETSKLCTFQYPEFYSARREGITAGRFGIIAYIK